MRARSRAREGPALSKWCELSSAIYVLRDATFNLALTRGAPKHCSKSAADGRKPQYIGAWDCHHPRPRLMHQCHKNTVCGGPCTVQWIDFATPGRAHRVRLYYFSSRIYGTNLTLQCDPVP